MPGVPTAELPPQGLDSYWLGVWRHALRTLKDQGTWRREQRPLLDEYVESLIAAREARVGFRWLDHLEDAVAERDIDFIVLGRIAGSLPMRWDRHTKRAAALAELLVLTPKAQKAHGIGARAPADAPPKDPEQAAADDLERLGERAHLRVVS